MGTKFNDLVGQSLTKVEVISEQSLTKVEVISEFDERINFYTDTGKLYALFHHQDYSEDVFIESITGDLENLIGTPILLADEETSSGDPPKGNETGTWTFYKLRTIKGSVDIRWYGTSNGYYSESVDFEQIQ